ncbi:unnamed protein product [Gongylonema pulchrum]|uniref:Nefa_Nip30_N domain-containing protein n=1 Tax=Gongylonema pulchrum TaxID=637853 RepID=A0A183DPF6_9BILA|nr:unnamed protein product [Gongylonema pulchrum]
MTDRFVSEKELEEAKKRRQEEWEKVRKPTDPKEAPEEKIDNRSLYERLKEVGDRKQAEYEEEHKISNCDRTSTCIFANPRSDSTLHMTDEMTVDRLTDLAYMLLFENTHFIACA